MTAYSSDDAMGGFSARDHYLPQVTPESVTVCFAGFIHPFLPGKDDDWLAMAVRRALACTMLHVEQGPERTSNAKIQSDLRRFARVVGSTWQQLFVMPGGVESRVWDYSWRKWDGEGGTEVENGVVIGDPTLHKKFNAAVREMEWLQSFINSVAKDTTSQRSPWWRAELKKLRIERGRYLAPVFLAAFGEPITVNGWPHDARHPKPTPFMDFYQRFVSLAFGERATDDLPGVLKIARRQHRDDPVAFTEGLIPGL